MRNDKLKGAIIAKYGTYTAFSKEIGINPQQLSAKLNGHRPVTKPERILWSMLLEENGLFDEGNQVAERGNE